VATDRLPHRVAAARALGAVAELVTDGLERAALLEATGGEGVDTAIEIAGEDDAIGTAIELVKPAGIVVVAGIPEGPAVTITGASARRKGLDLRFARRMNRVYPTAIELVAHGRVDLAGVVSDRYPLEEAPAALASASRREGHKVVLHPGA
jgi:L-iditol 2-dehydrogenase